MTPVTRLGALNRSTRLPSTVMECIRGLSDDKIERIIIVIEDKRYFWDKAHKDYKDQVHRGVGGFVRFAYMSVSGEAEKLTEEQLEEFKEAFGMFEKDGAGTIDTNYLGPVMRLVGLKPTDAKIRDMVKDMDTDYIGTIDLPEFLSMMEKYMEHEEEEDPTEKAFRDVFKEFDKDNDGFISETDLRRAMAKLDMQLTDEEFEEMMQVADFGEDRRINYQEFVKVFTA